MTRRSNMWTFLLCIVFTCLNLLMMKYDNDKLAIEYLYAGAPVVNTRKDTYRNSFPSVSAHTQRHTHTHTHPTMILIRRECSFFCFARLLCCFIHESWPKAHGVVGSCISGAGQRQSAEGGASVVSGWCLGGVSVVCPWCLGRVLVVSR